MKRLVLAATLALLAATPAGADHIESVVGPGEPQREFPADFAPLLPLDAQAQSATTRWADPHVGGWGGAACGHAVRRPVIFVHGTTADAWFWRAAPSGDGTIVDVRRAFLDDGWCERELWAISYTGAPGYFTSNDVNTGEVFAFIAAVRTYTGAATVDVVSHSLGVTVVRKAMLDHPELYTWIARHVAIAGANHGTTACRGLGTARGSHVCEETEPGSAWLAELNGADETPPGPRSLTILDGTGLADNFYLGPDGRSPELAGACNLHLPLVAHNTLARGRVAVDKYLPYLRDNQTCGAVGGSGEEAAPRPPTSVPRPRPRPAPRVAGNRLPATGVSAPLALPALFVAAAAAGAIGLGRDVRRSRSR